MACVVGAFWKRLGTCVRSFGFVKARVGGVCAANAFGSRRGALSRIWSYLEDLRGRRRGARVVDADDADEGGAGTGGFLVETFNHLSKQVKTVAHRKLLQEESISGCEPKSLPYLLCQMNLLLHGLDAPHIDPENALRFKQPRSLQSRILLAFAQPV
jgi:hypothetical protein